MKTHLAIAALLALPAFAGETATPAPARPVKANYELASRWTATKVGKLIFDTSVTPHWLDSGDRFWYTFENNHGRKFYLVDMWELNRERQQKTGSSLSNTRLSR